MTTTTMNADTDHRGGEAAPQATAFTPAEQGDHAMTDTMRAVVMHAPGGSEVLRIGTRPVPRPSPGEVLIRVEAFGLNRSELFTRQGHSPGVTFPRVLGIEATGSIAAAPGGGFAVGDKVATVMGGKIVVVTR